MKRVLTGITTTGSPHIGNYVGAIRPAIAASREANVESFYFLADLHALIKCDDPDRIQRSCLEIAATWLACGLDPHQVYFYRQSDIREIPELTWLLTCVTAKGLMNRAHAYKAAADQNVAAGEDPDAGITMGLYSYPILMAADILIFNAHSVPVGRDQVQHIEMARDMAQRFNHLFGQGNELLVLPEAAVEAHVATLPGLDGRKMSKSYDNTIPLFEGGAKRLREAVMRIVTDSRAPGEPKEPEGTALFTIYQAFASDPESQAFAQALRSGLSWGEAKQQLFERIERDVAPMRERYDSLMAKPEAIEAILVAGARKARVLSVSLLEKLRAAVGLRPLSAVDSKPDEEREFDQEMEKGKREKRDSEQVIAADVSNPYRMDRSDDPRAFYFRINVSNDHSLLSGPHSSAKDAGVAAKQVKSAPMASFDVKARRVDDDTHVVRHQIQLFVGETLIARGNAYGDLADAEHQVAVVLESLRRSRPQDA